MGNVDKKRRQLGNRLQLISSQQPTNENFDEISELKTNISELGKRNEVMWKQRARVDWLQEGDNNTKFFHSYASTRRRINRISRIKNDRDGWVEADSDIAAVAMEYFSTLFTTSNPPQDDDISSLISCRVSDGQKLMLE